MSLWGGVNLNVFENMSASQNPESLFFCLPGFYHHFNFQYYWFVKMQKVGMSPLYL
jgi:hypothetical protein